MEDNLISKKDLLEITGISYGALYRYKRKKLIPDEWFIRRSTFTGQETFFPRDKILERIAQIQDLKSDVTLDRMADVLSPEVETEIKLTREMLYPNLQNATKNLLTKHEDIAVFDFNQVLAVMTADSALQSGLLSGAECEIILETLLGQSLPVKGDTLYCYRLAGEFCCIISGGPPRVSPGLHLVTEIDLYEKISGIKYLFRRT